MKNNDTKSKSRISSSSLNGGKIEQEQKNKNKRRKNDALNTKTKMKTTTTTTTTKKSDEQEQQHHDDPVDNDNESQIENRLNNNDDDDDDDDEEEEEEEEPTPDMVKRAKDMIKRIIKFDQEINESSLAVFFNHPDFPKNEDEDYWPIEFHKLYFYKLCIENLLPKGPGLKLAYRNVDWEKIEWEKLEEIYLRGVRAKIPSWDFYKRIVDAARSNFKIIHDLVIIFHKIDQVPRSLVSFVAKRFSGTVQFNDEEANVLDAAATFELMDHCAVNPIEELDENKVIEDLYNFGFYTEGKYIRKLEGMPEFLKKCKFVDISAEKAQAICKTTKQQQQQQQNNNNKILIQNKMDNDNFLNARTATSNICHWEARLEKLTPEEKEKELGNYQYFRRALLGLFVEIDPFSRDEWELARIIYFDYELRSSHLLFESGDFLEFVFYPNGEARTLDGNFTKVDWKLTEKRFIDRFIVNGIEIPRAASYIKNRFGKEIKCSPFLLRALKLQPLEVVSNTTTKPNNKASIVYVCSYNKNSNVYIIVDREGGKKMVRISIEEGKGMLQEYDYKKRSLIGPKIYWNYLKGSERMTNSLTGKLTYGLRSKGEEIMNDDEYITAIHEFIHDGDDHHPQNQDEKFPNHGEEEIARSARQRSTPVKKSPRRLELDVSQSFSTQKKQKVVHDQQIPDPKTGNNFQTNSTPSRERVLYSSEENIPLGLTPTVSSSTQTLSFENTTKREENYNYQNGVTSNNNPAEKTVAKYLTKTLAKTGMITTRVSSLAEEIQEYLESNYDPKAQRDCARRIKQYLINNKSVGTVLANRKLSVSTLCNMDLPPVQR